MVATDAVFPWTVLALALLGFVTSASTPVLDDEHLPHLPLPDYNRQTGNATFFPRIVGGTLATLGEFPGKVSLQNRQGFHFCGGTMIDEFHILTAAHCMTDDRGRVKAPNTLQVMGADLSILSAGSSARQTRRVSHIFVHTNYSLTTMVNDVAVLRVDSAFQLTNTFRPVQLASNTPATNTSCHVAGWGATVENGTATARLQRMTITVLARSTCNARYSYNGLVRTGMICAGTMAGGRDSCQGDSGGGLICDGLVAGVVSFGYGCARPLFPGVYADVSVQHAFVRQAILWRGTHAAVPVPTTVKPGGGAAGLGGGGGGALGVALMLMATWATVW